VLFVCFFLALGLLTTLTNGFFYFASRRFIPVVPLLVVLWAGGLTVLWQGLAQRGGPRALRGALVGVLIGAPVLLQSARLGAQALEVVKPDMRAVVTKLGPELTDGDAIAVGPYVFFDFLYSFHADAQIDDWYQAGGAPRWLEVESESGAKPIDVLVSASDIALPWEQVATHSALRRIWLLEIAEAPYGLRELKGPGTVTTEALERAGLEPCAAPGFEVLGVSARCFQAQPTSRLLDDLRVGQGDYRQVMGFAPPGPVRSYARRLAPSGRVRFGGGAPARRLQLTMLRWFEEPVDLLLTVTAGSHVQRERVRLERRKETVDVTLTLPEPLASQPIELRLDAPPELVEASPACFRYRRERYRRGWLDCGIFLRRATLTREASP
jgi:hypothetical protein